MSPAFSYETDLVAKDEVVIEATGLSKFYGEVPAVTGLNFNVRRGECFGFLGPKGAGKTTTVNSI